MFTRNDYQLDVRNGQRGKVSEVNEKTNTINVETDNGQKKTVDTEKYNHIEYGWASTTHKAQGATAERAMLFVYAQDGEYAFWMKNVGFPLDIVWLNAEKKVVHIKEDFAPCLKGDCPAEYPGVLARYIIEFKAGTVRDLGLKLGDEVRFD